MENIVITAATPEELRSGELGRQLRHYNYGFGGEYPEQQYIRLNARDGNGRLLGGLRSFVFLNWLSIEVLFVEVDVRGSGLGSRLLVMKGAVDDGLTLCGHTGVGPGGVVAVYRSTYGANTASCAVFREGSGEGFAEAEIVRRVSAILKPEKHDA